MSLSRVYSGGKGDILGFDYGKFWITDGFRATAKPVFSSRRLDDLMQVHPTDMTGC